MKAVCVLCLCVFGIAYTSAAVDLPELPASGKCEPGKSYKQDCNTCICGPDGKAGCTYKFCPPRSRRSPVPEDLQELPADGKCEPGKSYKKECNTCRCNDDGLAACTLKLCVAPRSRRSTVPEDLPELPVDGKCESGKSYKKECNTCVCNNGIAACTEKFCIPQRTRRSPVPEDLPELPADGKCEPGKSYKKDCNTCRCSNDGVAACTAKFCIPQKSRRSPAPEDLPELPADGKCESGKVYKQDCNTCRCTPDGKAACTYKLCPPRTRRSPDTPLPPAPADGNCVPGQQYQKDCNTCLCGANGKLGACTIKACISKRSTPLPPLPADGSCVAGNSYQKDCNVCRCLEGGKLACTDKLCVSKRSAEPQECSAGETKQEACNTCHCANGVWACTKQFCVKHRRSTPLQPIPADGTCVPGNAYQLDCNTCTCLEGGKLACTKRGCNVIVPAPPKCSDGEACPTPARLRRAPQQCRPGDVRQQSCNTCRCANGVWACTRRYCPNRKRRDTDECAVGDSKKIDCNDCKCTQTADGKTGWACTRRFCPANIPPPRLRRDVF